MEVYEKIYYMRAIIGIIGGIVLGLVLVPGTDQGSVVMSIIMIGIIFYIISHWIAKQMMPNVPKDEKKKFMTNGIFPFIFLMLMFMILAFTILHQSLAIN
ncbi:MAG: hypothetical protein ACPKPY_11880 [Nitrososphaeraceae archaeon]